LKEAERNSERTLHRIVTVNNAKFAKSGGPIAVGRSGETLCLTLDYEWKGKNMDIRVKQTVIGMNTKQAGDACSFNTANPSSNTGVKCNITWPQAPGIYELRMKWEFVGKEKDAIEAWKSLWVPDTGFAYVIVSNQ